MKVTARAPGKIILIGEHFVVYGKPAVVMAINRYVQVTVEDRNDHSLHISSNLGIEGTFVKETYKPIKGIANKRILEPIKISAETALNALKEKRGLNITIQSRIPMAVGLGSSGALAVALVSAIGKLLGKKFTNEEIIALSTEAEKFVHIFPSGIDQAISTWGEVLIFKKKEDFTRLEVASDIPLVIGNTGIIRNTGKMVSSVRRKQVKFPEIMNSVINAAGHLSQKSIDALKNNDLFRLGELMDINHGLLMTLGVSHEALDKLVYAAKKNGALGAKLTGAGGGGCMIALTTLEKREKVFGAIHKAGGIPIIAEKAHRGVYCWIDD